MIVVGMTAPASVVVVVAATFSIGATLARRSAGISVPRQTKFINAVRYSFVSLGSVWAVWPPKLLILTICGAALVWAGVTSAGVKLRALFCNAAKSARACASVSHWLSNALT